MFLIVTKLKLRVYNKVKNSLNISTCYLKRKTLYALLNANEYLFNHSEFKIKYIFIEEINSKVKHKVLVGSPVFVLTGFKVYCTHSLRSDLEFP